jgi:succinate dehydrogenase / fumarate reductase membrane anchor subunit
VFANGVIKFLTFLFFVSLFYHAWIGVRDIWMDYVKPTGLRLTLHVLTVTALVGYTAWAAAILWRL